MKVAFEYVKRVKLPREIALAFALCVADEVAKKHGQELELTSVLDGVHSAGSEHYAGHAFDMRSRFWSKEEAQEVEADIRSRLGDEFDVVNEGDHIHIEYDPKRSR